MHNALQHIFIIHLHDVYDNKHIHTHQHYIHLLMSTATQHIPYIITNYPQFNFFFLFIIRILRARNTCGNLCYMGTLYLNLVYAFKLPIYLHKKYDQYFGMSGRVFKISSQHSRECFCHSCVQCARSNFDYIAFYSKAKIYFMSICDRPDIIMKWKVESAIWTDNIIALYLYTCLIWR